MPLLLLFVGCFQDHLLQFEVVEEVVPYDPVVESWVFPGPAAEVDVLLVMDMSCSMRDEIPRFTPAILDWTLMMDGWLSDWRLGVLTADPAYAGTLAARLDRTSTMGDRLQAASMLDPAMVGESGLLTAILAWELVPDFWRPGAAVVVLVVSDEPEESGISGAIWDAAWMDYGVTPRVGAALERNNDQGYADVVDVRVDIHGTSWAGALAAAEPFVNPGQDAMFELAEIPAEGSLQVWVDGTPAAFVPWAPKSFALVDVPLGDALVVAAYWPAN